MVNQTSFPQDSLAECFDSACDVLQRHHIFIRDLFPDWKIKISHTNYSTFIMTRIEVYFDSATLFCNFDKAGYCNVSYLRLKDPQSLAHFIEYCNKAFVFDSTLMTWKKEGCSIHMVPEEEGIFFYLLPEWVRLDKYFRSFRFNF